MRCACLTSRVLPLLVATLAVVFVSVSIHNARRLENEKVKQQRLLEVDLYSLSATKARDQEYHFVIENYGYKYRGKTGNLIDDSILVFGAWEKDVLFFLGDYVKAAGLEHTAFVDVGANTGQHALYMATRIKEVHAVEPFPPVIKSLKENISLSAFSNVKVHEVGFGEKEDSLPFYADEDWNQGGGTFREGDKEKKLVGNLRIVAADEFFKSVPMGPVGLVKMDIEGHEEAALKGMRQLLDKHRPLMVFEVTRPPGGTIASFAQLKGLLPADYEFLFFREDQKRSASGKYELADFAPVADEFFRTGDHYNLVVIPAEKKSFVPRSRK